MFSSGFVGAQKQSYIGLCKNRNWIEQTEQFAIMFAIKAWDVKTQVLCLKVFSFLIKWNIVHFNHVVSFLCLINPQRSDCNGHMDKFGSPHLTQKSCQCGIMAWELLLPSGNSSEAQFFFIPLAVTCATGWLPFVQDQFMLCYRLSVSFHLIVVSFFFLPATVTQPIMLIKCNFLFHSNR